MFYAEGQGWIKCFSFCPFVNEDENLCLYQTDFCVRITVHYLVYVCFVLFFPPQTFLMCFSKKCHI